MNAFDFQNDFGSVVVVGLHTVESGPVWWIGLKHLSPEFQGQSLDECEDEEEFGEMFCGSTCLEVHPPHPVSKAIERAKCLARERRLPLYRSTYFQHSGGDGYTYEFLDWGTSLLPPPDEK
jgi:hypothetical protein